MQADEGAGDDPQRRARSASPTRGPGSGRWGRGASHAVAAGPNALPLERRRRRPGKANEPERGSLLQEAGEGQSDVPPPPPPEAACHAAAVAPDVWAELRRLTAENEALRRQVWELQAEALASSAGDILQKATSGPLAMKHAPIDLYIVYSIKFAECVAYYGIAYVYVTFLSEEINFTDEEAGDLYSVYGLLCTVVGLQMGHVIDRLGVRRSMMVGSAASLLARLTLLFSTSKWWNCFAAVTFFPVGAAFGVPVLALGVRRYTHEDNRGFAFSFFYAVLCLACLVGSIIINRVRAYWEGSIEILGLQVTWLRVVVFICCLFTAYTLPAAACVRDIQVLSDRPLKERAYCVYVPRGGSMLDAMKDVIGQRRFWRLAAVTLMFCGVRMTFRHLDATFPKYFTRTFGPQAPFELILCINPMVTMVATPFVTAYLLKHKVPYDQTLLVGAFLSGLSIFCLSLWESFSGAVAFVLVLSVGEAIWSPKLYELSTMAAPEGREGIYLAITMAPMYLASVPVGTLSGWALNRWCPKDDTRHGRFMWFVLGLIGFCSPVLLLLFRRRLFKPGDDAPPVEGEGEGQHRQLGRATLPKDDKEDLALPQRIGQATALPQEQVGAGTEKDAFG